MPNSTHLRILDASANRVTEGLRVVEDYIRFVLDDGHLTGQLKEMRHDLSAACAELLGDDRYPVRDTPNDVGTEISTESEVERVDAWDVCVASLERSKQAIRSLEEYSKITSPELSSEFEAMRYGIYSLEKALSLTRNSCQLLERVNLCVLIDGHESPEAFLDQVDRLLSCGVGMIQLRDKQLSDRELLTRARMLAQFAKCSDNDPPAIAIVNDRADIAAAAGADGVHLGQDDMQVHGARAILGPRKLIGVSTHSYDQARTAVLDGADYLGAGPTFPSQTKKFKKFPGVEFLKEVADQITLPTFAIGGITPENLPEVLKTGITRVAVSSAASAAGELLQILQTKDQ